MRISVSSFLFFSVCTTLGHCWVLVIIVFLHPSSVMGLLTVGEMCFFEETRWLGGKVNGCGYWQEGPNLEDTLIEDEL